MYDRGIFKSYKILFLCKWYPNKNDPYNGIFIKKHAEAIAAYCKVTVLYAGSDILLKDKTYNIENSLEEGIRTIRVYYKNSDISNNIGGKIIKTFRYFNALYKGLKIVQAESGKPHAVHVNVLNRLGIAALFLKLFKKIPYIITEHWTGYLPHSGKFKGGLRKMITGLVIKHAEAITTVSENLKNQMLAHGLRGNYVVVPNVISNMAKITERKEGNITAINVSDMVDEMKNISGIIKAVAEVIPLIPDFELYLVGEGKDRNNLIELANNLELLNKNIFFHGYRPNEKVYEMITNSSFLIVNSNYETFSVVAAEALSCGVPVLTTSCGGPEEFITKEYGIVIEPGKHQELIDSIKWMAFNYRFYDAQKLKNYAINKFGAEVIADKFLALYKKHVTKWKAGNSQTTIHIDPDWKVLDVGSGNRPNERANVLLEKELDKSEHRSGARAVIPEGKEIVLGDALAMPFKENEFDFIIASHIAEHVDDPELFCKELSRTGKRGYVETPGIFCEFIFNEPFHKWIVYNSKGTLIFKEKKKYKVFSEFFYRLYYLNEKRMYHKPFTSSSLVIIKMVNLMRKLWKYIPYSYTRFYWENAINYKIIRKADG